MNYRLNILLFQFIFLIVNNDIIVAGDSCGCSYDYALIPTDGPSPGAERLGKYFSTRFGNAKFEIYNNRNVRGADRLSLHAEGRAVDLYVTGRTGRKVFDHVVAIACHSGIQEVIFNRRIWTNEKGERHYFGLHPHHDHVHIGLNRCGAQNFFYQ